MAIEAEGALCAALEQIVTGAAGFLGLRVRFGDRSGHDQRLQAGRGGGPRSQKEQERDESAAYRFKTHARLPHG